MDRKTVLDAMARTEWPYALYDEAGAVPEMAERIARTGRLNRSLISYSNLVAGIEFKFSNIEGARPFFIDTHNWFGLHRRVIGDCLGYISYISYDRYDFMASALVAGLQENRPSDIFFEWMVELGALPNSSEELVTQFLGRASRKGSALVQRESAWISNLKWSAARCGYWSSNHLCRLEAP